MKYIIPVIETRTYRVQYTVDADNLDEALELAEAGDTVSEEELHLVDVVARQPTPAIVLPRPSNPVL